MIKIEKYLAPVLMALCGIVWAACKQERQPCLTPKTANLRAEFMHKTSDTATVFSDTALPSAIFIALTRSRDTGFVYPLQKSSFSLSLSSDTVFCQWAFRTDTFSYTVFDTLSFYYQKHRQFLSNACGFTYFYTLDSIHTSHKMIDSVHIINSSVTNDVITPNHLQVYIHPDY